MQNFDPGLIKKIQEQSLALQRTIAKMQVDGVAGSDNLMVTVTLNGKHEALKVELSPALLTQPVSIVQELIAAAITDAAHKLESCVQRELLGAAQQQ